MRRYAWLNVVALLTVLGVLNSCQNVFAPLNKTGLPPQVNNAPNPFQSAGTVSGAVSIKLAPIAPVLGPMLVATATTKNLSRAYLSAGKLHFTLYDSASYTANPATANVITSWDDTSLGSNYSVFNAMGQNQGGFAFSAANKVLPVGSYFLKVDVFNANNLTTPVVSGTTTASFSVGAGQTTPVAITCLPVNPTPITWNSTNHTGLSAQTSLPVAWTATNISNGGSAPQVTSVGSEQWYKVTLDASSQMIQFAAIPAAGSLAELGVFVYDGSGHLINGRGSTDTTTNNIAPGFPAELTINPQMLPGYTTAPASLAGDYYIGVVDFNTSQPATSRLYSLGITDSAPTNLHVSAQDNTSITLAWDTMPSASGATLITLYRDTSATGSFSTMVGGGPMTASNYTIYDGSLATGTTYFYKIQATYPWGTSPLWGPIQAIAQLSAPTTQVTQINFYNQTQNSISINWTGTPNTSWYNVNVYTDSTATILFSSWPYNYGTSATITGLNASMTYYFTVTPVNGAGAGPVSAILSSMTAAPQPPPMPYSLSVGGATSNALTLTWYGDSTATGYYIYRDTSYSGTFPLLASVAAGTYLTYTDNALASGTTYYYKVAAYNAAGISSQTNYAQGTTLATLLYPSGFSVVGASSTWNSSAGTGTVTLQWNAYTGAANYTVWEYDSTSGMGNYLVNGQNVLNTTFSGVVVNHNYVFYVMANNSGWSNNINYQRVQFNGTTPPYIISNFYTPYQTGNYNVRWSDSYSGNGTDTVDVAVAMQNSSGSLLFGGSTYAYGGVDSGYYTPQLVPLTAGSSYSFSITPWGGGTSTDMIELWYEPAQ